MHCLEVKRLPDAVVFEGELERARRAGGRDGDFDPELLIKLKRQRTLCGIGDVEVDGVGELDLVARRAWRG